MTAGDLLAKTERIRDTSDMSHGLAHPPQSPAPWAELVPGMPRMTIEEYERLPDDGWQYELKD
jgi:hypothetical protein